MNGIDSFPVLALLAVAQGWPQFLGPDRNGVYSPGDVSPAAKPVRVWQKDVGQGFSGPIVSDGRLYLFHRVANRETLEALEGATGKTLWKHDYPTTYRDDFGFDEGPRGTPAIDSGRVFTFGAEGMLEAVAAKTGTLLWSVDTQSKFGVSKGFFGAAASPLVDGSRVLVNVGGKDAGIVAFDAATGKVLWTATSDEAGYSSPVLATFGGRRLAVFFTRAGLTGVDPATGKVILQYRLRSRSHASVNAATPLVVGDSIFLSATYDTGAVLLRVKGETVTPVWSSDDALSNHYATSVYRDGFLFGFHGRQEFGQSFRAIELQTGKVAWTEDRFGAGTVTLAGPTLVIVRESGELVLAPASPTDFRPTTRAPLLPATVRAFPALADGRLYVRNEKTLACFDLRK